MDTPTLVYLLAVVAYSIYNWWKKSNKDSKKPQNSAPKSEKPEVPEWMKEIFGDVMGEEPAPTPKPAQAAPTQAENKPVKQTTLTTREPLSKTLEVKPTAKPVSKANAKTPLVDARSLESLESLEDVYATKTTHLEKREKVEAIDALVKPASSDFLPESTDDWRRAIILQTVLERHASLR